MKIYFFALLLIYCNTIEAQEKIFELIPLGIYGGGDESNLSAYLVSQKGQSEYLCLDAGTIRYGIQKAIDKGVLKGNPINIIRENIKGYFVSHGHLDHISGLVLNSPEDSQKPIYALPFVIDIFKKYYFIEGPWINFTNEGTAPLLNKYTYNHLTPNVEIPIENTNLYITAFELSHTKTHTSTAALVRLDDSYILYLGDTGADRIEKSTLLEALWKNCAPLIQKRQIKAILIEVSFPNEKSENALFGHLTPKLLQEELGVLERFVGNGGLRDLNVIITHVKPNAKAEEQIKKELKENNPYKVKYLFPKQGVRMLL